MLRAHKHSREPISKSLGPHRDGRVKYEAQGVMRNIPRESENCSELNSHLPMTVEPAFIESRL